MSEAGSRERESRRGLYSQRRGCGREVNYRELCTYEHSRRLARDTMHAGRSQPDWFHDLMELNPLLSLRNEAYILQVAGDWEMEGPQQLSSRRPDVWWGGLLGGWRIPGLGMRHRKWGGREEGLAVHQGYAAWKERAVASKGCDHWGWERCLMHKHCCTTPVLKKSKVLNYRSLFDKEKLGLVRQWDVDQTLRSMPTALGVKKTLESWKVHGKCKIVACWRQSQWVMSFWVCAHSLVYKYMLALCGRRSMSCRSGCMSPWFQSQLYIYIHYLQPELAVTPIITWMH